MIYINITNFVLEKDYSMIETRRLKNIVIFFQTILGFVLSRKNNIFMFQEPSTLYLGNHLHFK